MSDYANPFMMNEFSNPFAVPTPSVVSTTTPDMGQESGKTGTANWTLMIGIGVVVIVVVVVLSLMFSSFKTTHQTAGKSLPLPFGKRTTASQKMKTLAVTEQGNAQSKPERVQFFIRTIGKGATVDQALKLVRAQSHGLKDLFSRQKDIDAKSVQIHATPLIFQGTKQSGAVLIHGSHSEITAAQGLSIPIQSIPASHRFEIPHDNSFFVFQFVTVDARITPQVSDWLKLLSSDYCQGFVITFSVEEDSLKHLESEAYRNAIAHARSKASKIAEFEHYKLGELERVEQNSPNVASSQTFNNHTIHQLIPDQVFVHVNSSILASFYLDAI